ncbi:metallophosphoesterase [Sansalvadorimonas sp. 2012CJ34-2]|uniref:Metallophosphoesterase n=1 Tax=Parendozoicomonas callyspongiae TaxID=2942213 RepID=A0ABT0PJ59_9GAMM|nr:metallophosphoesterase [Sansalvadorimonas sp. 2012CJ34-2]MCL6271419.1 metallophosphoesterase [Sansalvadorimonas sp. 2012CJ34-2]
MTYRFNTNTLLAASTLIFSQSLFAETVSFIALGDFGTGDNRQKTVARAMEQVCKEKACDFVIGLGDNVYDKGVTRLDDPFFQTHYEQPYAGLNIPFFMTLGNHDISLARYPEGETVPKGDIQVQYHYQENRTSNKWRMPARYYTFSAPLDSNQQNNRDVDFLALDATPIAADQEEASAFYAAKDFAQQQSTWLANTMPDLNARWRVAFSHYPYISNGRHGNAGSYDNNPQQGQLWKELIEEHLCGKVHLLVSGHDHSLQLLDPVEGCGETIHIISGAGGKYDKTMTAPKRNFASWQQAGTLGFFWIQMTDERVVIEAWTVSEQQPAELQYLKSIDYFSLKS